MIRYSVGVAHRFQQVIFHALHNTFHKVIALDATGSFSNRQVAQNFKRNGDVVYTLMKSHVHAGPLSNNFHFYEELSPCPMMHFSLHFEMHHVEPATANIKRWKLFLFSLFL